jgi:hypothetical protein
MSKISARAACTDYGGYYSAALEMDLIARLVVLLDLLWDCSKEQTALWTLISDVVEEMLLLEDNDEAKAKQREK